MKLFTKIIMSCLSILGTIINPVLSQSSLVYSVKLNNLTFDCDNVGTNHRIILHDPFYIEKHSNTSIDIYAYQSNYTYSLSGYGFPKNLVANYTYNNITSISISNLTYGYFGIRPWRYDIKIDLKNRIFHMSANSFTKNDTVINVIYYYNVNNTRIPACSKKDKISDELIIDNTYSSSTAEDGYFDEITFPYRPMPTAPVSGNIYNSSTAEDGYYLPENPSNNDTILIKNIEADSSDKFEGTVLTEKQFWTLVGGLGGGILLICLMIKLIKREKRLAKELFLKQHTFSEV